MGHRQDWSFAPRLLVAGALLCLCLAALSCGSSSNTSGEEARLEREAVEEAREDRENRRAESEFRDGDFVHCGRKVYASKRSLCAFAMNVESAYFIEVTAGPGKAIGYHPGAEQDYMVHCGGTLPHKCGSFDDEGEGIESLKSGVIFFWP